MALADLFPALFDNYFIKVLFLIHATLISLANVLIGNNGTKLAYLSYNSIFLLTLILAILVDKNTDVILVSTAFNVICMLLDVVTLISANYPGLVSTLIIVMNLIFRPLSSILLLRNYSARAGVEDPTSGLLEVDVHGASTTSASSGRPRSTYQNIDEPNQALP